MARRFTFGMAAGALALWTGLGGGIAQPIKTLPPSGAPAQPGPVWYYCDNPTGYYPYVQSCSAWRAVPASPGSPQTGTNTAPTAPSQPAPGQQGATAKPTKSGPTAEEKEGAEERAARAAAQKDEVDAAKAAGASTDEEVQAAIKKHRDEMYAAMQQATKDKDYAQTFELAKRLFIVGDIRGASRLGGLYLDGLGVPKNETRGLELIRKAVKAGWPPAEAKLGDMYKFGVGVTKDSHEAFVWYRQAADQGEPYGLARLGEAYVKGEGIAADPKQGVELLRKSAELGNQAGQYFLGWTYDRGTGVAQDYKEAATWYRKAADQGLGPAQLRLGQMYAGGEGVTKDPNEALAWYQKAAQQGIKEASDAVSALSRERDEQQQQEAALKEAQAEAVTKGEDYARRAETTWHLIKKKNEMTDAVDQYVLSDQIDEEVRGQVKMQCSSIADLLKLGSVSPGAPAAAKLMVLSVLVVDKAGNPTVKIPETRGAITGLRRVNDNQPTSQVFQTRDFSNDLLLGTMAPASSEGKELGFLIGQYLNADTAWRLMFQIETSQGKLLIRIPLFDPAIRELTKSCFR